MLDAASATGRQVIITSHSPEIISRAPPECLRWVDRGAPSAKGGFEVGSIMEYLGVSANTYIPKAEFPDVLVYVEGIDDRPVIESLIKWYRGHVRGSLPTTLVIPHRAGRFEGPTLQGITRFARESKNNIAVVGIRDLDWYYDELPADEPAVATGDGWRLLTLPCKELENLFCEAPVLLRASGATISEFALQRIIDAESENPDLIQQWKYQVRHRVRDRLPCSHDASTKERLADETFAQWVSDPRVRQRLVSGKGLLGRVRNRIRKELGKDFYPSRIFTTLDVLTPSLQAIITSVFPTDIPTTNAAVN